MILLMNLAGLVQQVSKPAYSYNTVRLLVRSGRPRPSLWLWSRCRS